jgi:peptidoglycan hydrolase-like protein with peptidoglycan-binding domain
MAEPTIHFGSTGKEVKEAQQYLFDRGYFPTTADVDGNFGPRTRAAVIAYQTDRTADPPSPPAFWAFTWPLHVDGIVGPFTWGRLEPDTIKKGSKGAYVRLLQSMLKAYGPAFDPGPVDGDFGTNTETAVKAFQTAFAPPNDGIVGPKTWLALWS